MKKILKLLAILIVLAAIGLLVTGNGYVFKTLVHAFPDIDDLNIFEKRIVSNGVPDAWPFSVNYNKVLLPVRTDSENIRNESVAFLVIKDDSIAYEQYWDEYNDSSVINPFSVSKSIVGILTGIAVDEKLITLNDPVGKFIPAFNKSPNDKLKIIDLLKMSSGLNWDESYQSLISKTTEAYYGSELMKEMDRLKVVEQPGVTFKYMSCNSLLLGIIISKASGMTLSEYASEKLWKQIGAGKPAYWSLDQEGGMEKSYCCFYSTARDFARVGKLLLDSGRYHGKQIVSSDYLAQSVLPNGCVDETGNKIDYYGWHWWLTTVGGKKISYARGILGQYIIVVPDEKIIIVRLGKKRGVKTDGNQYTDMISYTEGVLSVFGSHITNSVH